MVLLPLVLGVRSGSGAEKASASQLKSIAEKTQKRDDYACRFCGFRAKQYQRVISYAGAGDPPFATVCILCEPCLNLERNGVTGSGLLLWMPEITQVDLHHLVRAIYVARAEKGAMQALATRALDALTVRRAEAKKRLGSDDPMLLATVMRESLEEDDIKGSAAKLDGIRLLPSEKYIVPGPKGHANQMPRIAKYWGSEAGPYAAWPTSTWKEILQKALAAAGNA